MSKIDKIAKEDDFIPIPRDGTPVVIFYCGRVDHPLLVSYEGDELTVLKCPKGSVTAREVTYRMRRNMPTTCLPGAFYDDALMMAGMLGYKDVERHSF